MRVLDSLSVLMGLILDAELPESLKILGSLYHKYLLFISFIFYLLFLPLLRS